MSGPLYPQSEALQAQATASAVQAAKAEWEAEHVDALRLADIIEKAKSDMTPSGRAALFNGRRCFYAYQLMDELKAVLAGNDVPWYKREDALR